MYGTFFDYQYAHEDYFIKQGQKVTYKKGQYVVSSIEESPWVFFLAEGTVQASFSFIEGAQRLIGFFVPGMSFAKSGAFFADSGGDLEYIAATNATLYRISQKDFFTQLQTNSVFNQEYMTWLLKTQILLIERVVYQGEITIQKKFLRWLLFMAKYYGLENAEVVRISVATNHNTIANFLHVTRESISRVTTEMVNAGIITINKKYISIHSPETIKTILDI